MARRVFLSFVFVASLLATAVIAEGLGSARHGHGTASGSDWRDGYGIDDRTAMVTARAAIEASTDETMPR